MTFAGDFTASLFRAAGWPQSKGLLRRRVVDPFVADAVFSQLGRVGVVLGAEHPALALQLIKELVNPPDDMIEDLLDELGQSDKLVQNLPTVPPWHAIMPQPFSLMAKDVPWGSLGQPDFARRYKEGFLYCLGWGLLHPQEARDAIEVEREQNRRNAPIREAAGLILTPEGGSIAESIGEAAATAERCVRDYEAHAGSLPLAEQAMLNAPRVVARFGGGDSTPGSP